MTQSDEPKPKKPKHSDPELLGAFEDLFYVACDYYPDWDEFPTVHHAVNHVKEVVRELRIAVCNVESKAHRDNTPSDTHMP